MADHGEDYEGGEAGEDAHTLLAEENVNDAELKLPQIRWDQIAPQEIKSGEEEEEVLYKHRGKLFRFTGGEWKERGLGDVKLLRHRTTGAVRLLMRQEKTLKVCANHVVAPECEMHTPPGTEKSLIWAVLDVAEGEPKNEKFLIRFKDTELTAAFKAAWDNGRQINKELRAAGKALGATSSPVKAGAPATAASAAGAPVAAGAASAAAGAIAAAAPSPAPAKVEDKSGPVLVTDNLDKIYGAEASVDSAVRYGKVTETFRLHFGSVPTFYVRAPGRVNLIGEHIDYHGYSVLPMALAQDTVIAVGVADSTGPIRVANTDSAKYPEATLPADPAAPVDRSAGVKWHQYVQCGYKGAFDFAKAKGKSAEPKGLLMMVDGRVPTGAGVSSSSALVVASLLAVAQANGIAASMTRADIGEAARKSELYIGTMSGGMDQAIACLAEAGSAARIDFEPLRAAIVHLPKQAAFVVSNTLEESAKAVDAEKRYNRRVTEGKLGAKIVAKGLGVPNWASIQTFRQLQEAMKLSSPGALLPAIEKQLRAGAYSVADVEAALGVSATTVFEGDAKKEGALKVLSSVSAEEKTFELLKVSMPIQNARWYLGCTTLGIALLVQRARHVCSEAERVLEFEAACQGARLNRDGSRSGLEGGEEAQLKLLGELMTASQASCRDDYECSSEALDEITSLARSHGAYGSRLTGAGWGGCAVSLVHASKVKPFIAALTSEYYARRSLQDRVSTALFASAPGAGAAIYTPPTSFEI